MGPVATVNSASPTIPIESLAGLVKRGNKFHAVKTTIDGITFDSKKEARRWRMLVLLKELGAITELERQVSYDLTVNGVKVARYVADFRYRDKDRNDELIVEDVKSEATRKLPLYRLKRRLMLACHQIVIRES